MSLSSVSLLFFSALLINVFIYERDCFHGTQLSPTALFVNQHYIDSVYLVFIHIYVSYVNNVIYFIR